MKRIEGFKKSRPNNLADAVHIEHIPDIKGTTNETFASVVGVHGIGGGRGQNGTDLINDGAITVMKASKRNNEKHGQTEERDGE